VQRVPSPSCLAPPLDGEFGNLPHPVGSLRLVACRLLLVSFAEFSDIFPSLNLPGILQASGRKRVAARHQSPVARVSRQIVLSATFC